MVVVFVREEMEVFDISVALGAICGLALLVIGGAFWCWNARVMDRNGRVCRRFHRSDILVGIGVCLAVLTVSALVVSRM